jgi:hypothetical protein
MADPRRKTKIYIAWCAMKTRCFNPKATSFNIYGGRGIKISKEWLCFENFFADMALSFRQGLSIDRIDVNGNYCRENCKWSTKKEQANNRRTSKIIQIGGERKTLAQWCELSSVKASTVRQRIYCYNWSAREALSF